VSPLAALCLLLLPGGTDRAAPLAAQARSELASGSATQALARAEEALEWAPEDALLLELASQAAEADKEPDRALCYAALALELATAPEQAPLVESLKKRIGELDPLAGRDRALLGEYAAALLALGNDCAARKLWVNAVALLARTQGSSSSAAGDAALAKIYDNKKAVEALLDSGLDVPIRAKKQRTSAAKLAAEDKLHSTWENCWEIKGNCYTIKTDMPRELALQMSLAMEQMNAFYRKVFHVKEHGGGETARVVISVYKTRAEFDKYEGDRDKNVAGFFVPNANRVATYDPREDGRPLSELWSTLFHEASHQFTHLISADLIPSWLNEGTASYFEGARLLPNASVETNLVPEERLGWLPEYFKQGKPKLEDVVKYYQPGSYEGDFYPFGWGLVYFLLNYENDKSVRVYEPLYRDYMAAYKSGGKHDVFGRFVEHFVTKAKDPAVKTFADFEARWKKWILEQHELYFGPPTVADTLIARGRKQRTDKQSEAAVESFRAALRKRPGDVVANFELGETLNAAKLADAALFHYQKCVQGVRALADPAAVPASGTKPASAMAEESLARIGKLNKELAEKLGRAEAGFATGAAETAQAYVEKGLPLYALRFLARAEAAFGGSRALAELRARLATENRLDVRRWRRLPLDEGLAGWQGSDAYQLDGDAIAVGKEGGFCWADDEPQIPYRLEARIEQADSKKPEIVGLMFGQNPDADSIQGVLLIGPAVLASELTKEGWKDDKDALIGTIAPKKACTLAIEVRETEVEVFVDGVSIGKHAYEAKKLTGGVGLAAQGVMKFRELRVKD
jgi:tetratricopeptide (TPR) repeat protein